MTAPVALARMGPRKNAFHPQETTMDPMMELRLYEHDARRLRAQYVRDLLIRTVIAFDLAIRRAASRVQSLTCADASRLSGSP
jgi:hypothetical protein